MEPSRPVVPPRAGQRRGAPLVRDYPRLPEITPNVCLDNAEVHLSSEQLWAHLNYQLIHLIDFLPATAWQVTFNDYFAVFFVRLHALLQRAGKLPPPLPGRVCHSLLHISFVFLLLPGRTSSRSLLHTDQHAPCCLAGKLPDTS